MIFLASAAFQIFIVGRIPGGTFSGHFKLLYEDGVKYDLIPGEETQEQEATTGLMGTILPAGTAEEPRWLNLIGHSLVELDDDGRPAYIINTVNDVTKDVEEVREAHDLSHKYERLSNMPMVALSFYDEEGNLSDINETMRRLCHFDKLEQNYNLLGASIRHNHQQRRQCDHGTRHLLEQGSQPDGQRSCRQTCSGCLFH